MSANQNQPETGLAIRMQDLSPAYAEIMILGNVLQKSGYFKDVRDQAQAVTKILCGRELGFSPIVSMQGIHIIEGKPALSSNLMATLIKRSGKYDYRVKTWTHQECVLTFREKVEGKWEEVGESSFDMNDAKNAGVIRPGGSWAKYPKPMMFARALSMGLRTYCPDVSAAPVYSPEEMGAEVTEEGDVTQLPKSARSINVERTTEEIPIEPGEKAVEPEAVATLASAVLTAADRHGIGSPAKEAAAEPTSSKGPEPPKTPDTETGRAVKAGDADSSRTAPTEVSSVAPQPVRIDKLPPVSEIAEQAKAAMSPKEGTVAGDCIAVGQQSNLHRGFRSALRKELQKQADDLLRNYLKQQGIVDSNGEGTARAILKTSFYDVRNACEEHARSL